MLRKKGGMTLLEVLFATVILGICVFSLFQCLTMNLEAFRKTDFPQGVANVIALADAKYPFVITIAKKAPRIVIQIGVVDGNVRAKRIPVTTALKSFIRTGVLIAF